MEPTHTPPVSVRMPDELRRWVEQRAAETDRSVSAVIRRAVRQAKLLSEGPQGPQP